jgi:hypothetical protein
MARDEREPQSYGSGSDWLTGKTGQNVNDPKAVPTAEHREFYDERRESESSDENQGGRTSDLQLGESHEPGGQPAEARGPSQKVSAQPGGAKRDSYFKKRDYD